MNILRLDPPVLLDTPKGKALAIIFQDYGFDHHNLWTCVIEETGDIWTFQNPAVRARADYTFGVRQEAKPQPSEPLPVCGLCGAYNPCTVGNCRFPGMRKQSEHCDAPSWDNYPGTNNDPA